MPEPTTTVRLTPDEALLVERALDLYSRLQMGQLPEVASHTRRADMTVEGRLAFQDALRDLNHHVTGLPTRPHASRYPDEYARTTGEIAIRLFEHLRYARTADRYSQPLAFDVTLVTREQP